MRAGDRVVLEGRGAFEFGTAIKRRKNGQWSVRMVRTSVIHASWWPLLTSKKDRTLVPLYVPDWSTATDIVAVNSPELALHNPLKPYIGHDLF
jgi:hypothetical protein